ncbi:molybdenum cofactor guanylyltransferase [soil metagenome]
MTSAAGVTAGAVLCGGASRRMGTDKSILPIDGVPMAERVAQALEAAGCAPVALIGGDPARLADLRRPFIADRWPGQGPLGGVITALHASNGTDVVVAACDLAWLDPATVGQLLAAARSTQPTPDAVVALTTRLEPALAWWSATCLPALEAQWARHVRALREAIDALDTVMVVDVDPSALRNVNTPHDVAEQGRRG